MSNLLEPASICGFMFIPLFQAALRGQPQGPGTFKPFNSTVPQSSTRMSSVAVLMLPAGTSKVSENDDGFGGFVDMMSLSEKLWE
jgi:hypothetical protein